MQLVTHRPNAIWKVFLSTALAAAGLALAGCSASPALMLTAPSQVAPAAQCPAGSTKVCHVKWASKIRRNQREYSCGCETL